jgi:hypothetical protein
VNEAEWLGCNDPQKMLEALQTAGTTSDRKLRLFACACCRRVWHCLAGRRCRDLVQLAEDFADDVVTEEAMVSAWQSIVADLARRNVDTDAHHAVGGTAFTKREMPPGYGPDTWPVAYVKYATRRVVRLSANPEAELVAQSAALRCLFGNPLQPPPLLPLAVMAWEDGTVVKIAHAAYEQCSLPSGHLDNARLSWCWTAFMTSS